GRPANAGPRLFGLSVAVNMRAYRIARPPRQSCCSKLGWRQRLLNAQLTTWAVAVPAAGCMRLCTSGKGRKLARCQKATALLHHNDVVGDSLDHPWGDGGRK